MYEHHSMTGTILARFNTNSLYGMQALYLLMLLTRAKLATEGKGFLLRGILARIFNVYCFPIEVMGVLICACAKSLVCVVTNAVMVVAVTKSLVARQKMYVTLPTAGAEGVATFSD
jgi:hypothetical protein